MDVDEAGDANHEVADDSKEEEEEEESHTSESNEIVQPQREKKKSSSPQGDPLTIPKGSIKRIMKIDGDVNQVANDAIILVAKATELFMEKLTKDAHDIATANGRKIINYNDLVNARELDSELHFMEPILPPRPVEEGEKPPVS